MSVATVAENTAESEIYKKNVMWIKHTGEIKKIASFVSQSLLVQLSQKTHIDLVSKL